jgi:hypothetical protein
MNEFDCKVPSIPRIKQLPCKLAEMRKAVKKEEIFVKQFKQQL